MGILRTRRAPAEPPRVPPRERMDSPLEGRKVRLRGPRGFGFAALLLMLAAAPVPAGAQVDAGTAQRTADAAIARLRSPYCPGLMLEVCPSGPAEALRDSIRAAAAQGQSAERIVEDVLARHGEEWRAVPRRSGAGLWAWIIPPIAALLGALFLWARVRAMRGQGRALPQAGGAAVSAEERARLESALREFERAEEVA